MKNTLLLLFAIFSIVQSYAQVGKYGQSSKNNESFKEYLTKNNDLLKIGDTLVIGKATDESGFRYISQGQGRMHPTHGGKKVTIHKIKSFGRDKSGFTMWISFKGFGLLPVDVDYENALDSGEIINPQGKMTKQQAIQKLKESKELLDLEIITQEDYDKVKQEMTKFIM